MRDLSHASAGQILDQLHHASRLNPLATQFLCLEAAKLIRTLQTRIEELENNAGPKPKKAKAPTA